MKILLVESPTKAKTIRKFLKGYLVIATYGHFLDLPRKEFGIYLKNGKIEAKYIPLKGKKKLIEKIKKLAQKSEEILIASDPDREGEMIAYEVKMILPQKEHKKIKRISVHEITRKAFLEALKNKSEVIESLVNAQKGRRYLDRIFGYKISPLLWSFGKALSAGRVQSAALRIIVDREKEIENFKKEEFFEVYLILENFPLKVVLVDKNLQVLKFKKEELEKIKKEILKIEKVKLEKIIDKKKKIYPPLPLDTENLQRLAYQFLKFPPKKTMFIAQKLFEMGLITYHRTQSHFVNKDFSLELKNFIEANYGKEYFSLPRSKKEKFSFEAHEAIRPTELKYFTANSYEHSREPMRTSFLDANSCEHLREPMRTSKLPSDFSKLYNLILMITVASHFKPLEYLESKFVFKSGNFYFLGLNKELIFDGFSKVFPVKEKFNPKPKVKESQEFLVLDKEFKKIETQPPARFTEASLIKKLKELGIGRPSTYVQTIETLKKRKYVILEKKYLKPTELGKKIYDYLIKNFPELIDLKFTALMEESLDKIAQNLLDYQEFIIDFWREIEKKSRFFSNLAE